MRVNSLSNVWLWLLAACLVGGASGCGTPPWQPKAWWSTWLDPSKNVVQPSSEETMPILQAEEFQELVPNSQPPTLDDLKWGNEEYVLGPGDMVDISVLDLFVEGSEPILRRQVSETGMIDMPLVRHRIRVGGLTVEQARQAIGDAYKPNILPEPTVTVLLVLQRQNTVNILGAVSRPGTYPIPKRNTRMLEVLAQAGDVTQEKIEYVYVIRQTAKAAELGPPEAEPAPQELTPEALPALPGTEAPGAVAPAPLPGVAPSPAPAPAPSSEAEAQEELRKFLERSSGTGLPSTQPVKPDTAVPPRPTSVPATQGARAESPSPAPLTRVTHWEYDGGWVPVGTDSAPSVGPRTPVAGPASGPAGGAEPAVRRPWAPADMGDEAGLTDDPYGWATADLSHMTRIIAVDLKKLKEGDLRQNIIIRDNDIIHVPTLEVGEFYVMGEVARPGVYSLTGRRVTVKMALAAAGDTGPLAWPSNSVLIRRVGERDEQIIPLRLDRIMSGDAPDYFLQPNDVVAVGTHIAAPFLAVVRNAFRMTYGFGFIYDRNFAEKNLGQFDEIDSFFR